MVMVTEDRKLTGLFLILSISHNMVIPNLKSYLKGIAVEQSKINRTCKEVRISSKVKMASLNQGSAIYPAAISRRWSGALDDARSRYHHSG